MSTIKGLRRCGGRKWPCPFSITLATGLYNRLYYCTSPNYLHSLSDHAVSCRYCIAFKWCFWFFSSYCYRYRYYNYTAVTRHKSARSRRIAGVVITLLFDAAASGVHSLGMKFSFKGRSGDRTVCNTGWTSSPSYSSLKFIMICNS